MALTKVQLGNLAECGLELVERVFAEELRRAVTDLSERPGCEKARTVTMQFRLLPSLNENGVCDAAVMNVACSLKLPPSGIVGRQVAISPTGDILYNQLSPRDVRQKTLPLRQEEVSGDE